MIREEFTIEIKRLENFVGKSYFADTKNELFAFFHKFDPEQLRDAISLYATTSEYKSLPMPATLLKLINQTSKSFSPNPEQPSTRCPMCEDSGFIPVYSIANFCDAVCRCSCPKGQSKSPRIRTYGSREDEVLNHTLTEYLTAMRKTEATAQANRSPGTDH